MCFNARVATSAFVQLLPVGGLLLIHLHVCHHQHPSERTPNRRTSAAPARVVSNGHEYFIPNIFESSPRPSPLRERLFIFVLLQRAEGGRALMSCFFFKGGVLRKHGLLQLQRFYRHRHGHLISRQASGSFIDPSAIS